MQWAMQHGKIQQYHTNAAVLGTQVQFDLSIWIGPSKIEPMEEQSIELSIEMYSLFLCIQFNALMCVHQSNSCWFTSNLRFDFQKMKMKKENCSLLLIIPSFMWHSWVLYVNIVKYIEFMRSIFLTVISVHSSFFHQFVARTQ